LEGLLVAAEKLGDMAAFRGLKQKIQAPQRALSDDRTLMLQKRILDK
jgi:hypothetical protein